MWPSSRVANLDVFTVRQSPVKATGVPEGHEMEEKAVKYSAPKIEARSEVKGLMKFGGGGGGGYS